MSDYQKLTEDEDREVYAPFDVDARDSLLFQRNQWRARAEDLLVKLTHYRDHYDFSDDKCALCLAEDEDRREEFIDRTEANR